MKRGIQRRMTKIVVSAHIFEDELRVKAAEAEVYLGDDAPGVLTRLKEVSLEIGVDRLTGKIAGIKIATGG